MKLITRDHPDFYKSLPNYVFISINAEINQDTNLPFDENQYTIVDMDWASDNGVPPIDDDGCDMILHAIVVKD
jgi:hypothetical protein